MGNLEVCSLVMKVTKVIVLIESSRSAGRGLLRGITKYAQLFGPWIFYRGAPFYRSSSHVSEVILDQKSGREIDMAALIKQSGAHGIITYISDLKTARMNIPKGFPAVFIPLHKVLSDRPNLVCDSINAGRLAAEYFLKLGFENFGFCGYDEIYWSCERFRGFKEILAQAGYEVYCFHQSKPNTQSVWDSEQSDLADWVNSLPKPIGIWAWNDDLAEHLIEACTLSNLYIPDDVAVLGADNDELLCEMIQPSLSSVAFNFERAGFEMAEVLHKLMKGQKAGKSDIPLHTLNVVSRQSTDTLLIADTDVAQTLRYIRDNAQKPIQMMDVVTAVGISRRLLYAKFQKWVGRSIYDEIMQARAERIARILHSTNLPIYKIAYDFGFSGADHFARFFKKAKGVSPKQYRKNLGKI